MITIVLTNRNRDLQLVKNCLNSLNNQTNKDFECVLVDYGSNKNNLIDLQELIGLHPKIKLISCQTSGQLWCKSRAINIALKACETSHFFVGDIDMIYHSNFIKTLHEVKNESDTIYFQVGFLSEEESNKDKSFDDYKINFKSSHEATGMTLYTTESLTEINGYDEFYNGWGSEDTDVHMRLINAKKEVKFYNESILMLHQWHPKAYRSNDSKAPFHSHLEKINQKYLAYTQESKKVKANSTHNWGYYNQKDYKNLKNVDLKFNVTNELSDVKGFLNSVLLNVKGKTILVSFNNHEEYKSISQIVKKTLGKKSITFMTMQDINDLLLEFIIVNCRNCPYQFEFNRDLQEISLIIKL